MPPRDPVEAALKDAWSALLAGNTRLRDAHLERAKQIINAQMEPAPIKLVQDSDGTYRPEITVN